MSAPNVVIVGGYSETVSAMERIGDAAEDMGIWGHNEAFSLPQAWNQEREFMDKISQADEVATHSSGIMVLNAIARNIGGVRGINSFNGPEMPLDDTGEPTAWTRRGLVAASSRKTRGHLAVAVDDLFSPGESLEARQRLAIVAGNTGQILRRPGFHWRMLGQIRSFSTASALLEASRSGIKKLNDINSELDEFFPPEWKPQRDIKLAGAVVRTVAQARHDDVITNPRFMLGASRDELER